MTGTDYVFKINALEINQKDDTLYKERSLKPTNKNEAFSSSIQDKNHNFIKYLAPRDLTKDLIVCGTNLGKPHIYDLKESDLSNQLEYNGDYLCAGAENQNSLNLIDFQNGISKFGLMYSGIWLHERLSQTYGIFSRYGVFRKEIEINRHFARTLFSPHWLWEPEFVSITQDNKYIFYFFTEISIEHFSFTHSRFNLASLINLSNLTLNSNLVRNARVARVCKNDRGVKDSTLNGMWTTFRKIRLECSCNKDSNQNRSSFEIPAFSINFNNLKIMKTHANKLFGIFHERLPNILNGDSNIFSVICEYDFDLMRKNLETKNFWLIRANDAENDLEEDFDCENTDETLDDSAYTAKVNENLKFLSENTILDSSLVGECKLILSHRVTALTIETINENESLFYLGTFDGQLIRVFKNDSVYSTLSLMDLNNSSNLTCSRTENRNIIEILINEKNLYISTPDCLYQLSPTEVVCNGYMSCLDCNSGKEKAQNY